MPRLKLNFKPFSPPHLFSFTLKDPTREELEFIKDLGFHTEEKGNSVIFDIYREKIDELKSYDIWLSREINGILDAVLKDRWKILLKNGRYIEKSGRPIIMGILNVTPDSFFDGGKYASPDAAIERALEMIDDGADIIDVGGESARPGSDGISADEEMDRVIPVIEGLRKETDIPISIDTTKSEVAREAIRVGADLVNDISGFRFDKNMAPLCGSLDIPAVIMHTTGKPKVMQERIQYKDLIWDILEYLEEGLNIAKSSGLDVNKIIVDPGIGFGKKPEHNLTIINRVVEFKSLKRPVLLGTSRKSFIGVFLRLDNPKDRLEGSLAVASISSYLSVDILRVHDVKETRMVAEMVEYVKKEGECGTF